MRKHAYAWSLIVLYLGYGLLILGGLGALILNSKKTDGSCYLGYCSSERLYSGAFILTLFAGVVMTSSLLIAVGSFITWMTEEDSKSDHSKLSPSFNKSENSKSAESGQTNSSVDESRSSFNRPSWYKEPEKE